MKPRFNREVTIDPQERYIWVITNKGWEKQVGFFARWCGMDVTITPRGSNFLNLELVISSRNTGLKIFSPVINPFEYLQADTKEKTMITFHEILVEAGKNVSEEIMRVAQADDNMRLEEIVEEYGPMPLVEKIKNLEE